jgi:regulator of sigma E protease
MSLLANMPTGVAAVFWGVVTFSILVLLHEGGHFLAARAFGVKVHEFMLGLPGPALRYRSKRSGTAYGVTAIPLGGYCRIAGMEPGREDALLGPALGMLADSGRIAATDLFEALADSGVDKDRAASILTTLEDWGAAEHIDDWPEYRSLVERGAGETDDELLARCRSKVYSGQPAWKRVTILAAGVIVNLVTAILIFTITLSVWGPPTATLTLDQVQKGSAAAKVGLEPGDTIAAIGGHTVKAWDSVLTLVEASKPGRALSVTYVRSGHASTVVAHLGSKSDGTALLGVGPRVRNIPVPVLTALKDSFTWTGMVFVAVGQFFNPKTFSTAIGGARSVVGISYEVAKQAEAGPLQYAWMIALLSLSLGVMNILPIPPLDGGKVLMEIVEKLARRPIRKQLSYVISGVGTALLFSLIFYLMYADVVRYIVKG